jgi:hypothetical protein
MMNDTQVAMMAILKARDMIGGGMYVSSYEAAIIERLEHALNLLGETQGMLKDFAVPEGMTARQAAEAAAL